MFSTFLLSHEKDWKQFNYGATSLCSKSSPVFVLLLFPFFMTHDGVREKKHKSVVGRVTFCWQDKNAKFSPSFPFPLFTKNLFYKKIPRCKRLEYVRAKTKLSLQRTGKKLAFLFLRQHRKYSAESKLS